MHLKKPTYTPRLVPGKKVRKAKHKSAEKIKSKAECYDMGMK
jgi:hypothetical protein